MQYLSILQLGNKNLKCHLAENNRQLKYAESMILLVVAKKHYCRGIIINGISSLSFPLILPT